MGCICSFFKALTSYHGSHLTPKQVERQRQQRSRKFANPPVSGTPEKEPERSPSFSSPVRAKTSEEDRLLGHHMRPKLGDHERQGSQRLLGSFERQASVNQQKIGVMPKS